jgi:hypothetical protein
MTIDEDYVKTLGLTIIAGRNFDVNRISEIEDGLIINEAAVTKFGWETPENAIGKRVDSPSKHPAGEVIGVVRDYHEFGLQRDISYGHGLQSHTLTIFCHSIQNNRHCRSNYQPGENVEEIF